MGMLKVSPQFKAKMKFVIQNVFLKLSGIKPGRLNSYYFGRVLIVSLMLGGALFALSWSRTGENSISSEARYCFEVEDSRKCRWKRLKGKRLGNKDIEQITLTRCFCKNLYLSNVEVYESDFRENNFNQSFFKNVSFLGVRLFKAFFYGSVLENVVFKNSDLGGAVFNFATLRNVSFKNADLRSSLFIGADFENVSYDKETKLPFSESEAHQRGWFLEE